MDLPKVLINISLSALCSVGAVLYLNSAIEALRPEPDREWDTAIREDTANQMTVNHNHEVPERADIQQA